MSCISHNQTVLDDAVDPSMGTYKDLDLSAYVGSARCMVRLVVSAGTPTDVFLNGTKVADDPEHSLWQREAQFWRRRVSTEALICGM